MFNGRWPWEMAHAVAWSWLISWRPLGLRVRGKSLKKESPRFRRADLELEPERDGLGDVTRCAGGAGGRRRGDGLLRGGSLPRAWCTPWDRGLQCTRERHEVGKTPWGDAPAVRGRVAGGGDPGVQGPQGGCLRGRPVRGLLRLAWSGRGVGPYFQTPDEARSVLFAYLEGPYDRRGRHSARGTCPLRSSRGGGRLDTNLFALHPPQKRGRSGSGLGPARGLVWGHRPQVQLGRGPLHLFLNRLAGAPRFQEGLRVGFIAASASFFCAWLLAH